MVSLLRQWPLRVTLTALVITLAAVLLGVMLWQLVFVYQPNIRTAQAYSQANRMSDLLIEAAAEFAQERGMTATHLSLLAIGSSDAEMVEHIHTTRRLGDELLELALAQGEQLIAGNQMAEPVRAHILSVQSAWERVQLARQRVDRSSQALADIQSIYWLRSLNTLIERITVLRRLAFLPTTALESAAYKNIDLKQAIWLASEYADRERALLAIALAERTPLSASRARELMEYRGIVDRQLTYLREAGLPVLQMTQTAGVDEAWEHLQREFVLRFGAVRANVYAATAQGNYPLTERQWLQAATRGIDSLQAFGEVINASAAEDAAAASRSAQLNYQLSIAMLIGILLISAALVLLVKRICLRLHQAAVRVQSAERSNDLSLRLDATGCDELATLGRAYNALHDRLVVLIQAAHDATVEIGNASERIGAESTQIEQRIDQQHASLIQLATALTQIDALERELFGHTLETAAAAKRTERDALEGIQRVDQTLAGIESLNLESDRAAEAVYHLQADCREIGRLLEAMVGSGCVTEASVQGPDSSTARAEGMRSLISRMQQHVLQLARAIATNQHATDIHLEHIRTARTSFERIAAETGTFSQLSQQIAAVAVEPLTVTNTMYLTIDTLMHLDKENVCAAKQVRRSATDIGDQMQHLGSLASQFSPPDPR